MIADLQLFINVQFFRLDLVLVPCGVSKCSKLKYTVVKEYNGKVSATRILFNLLQLDVLIRIPLYLFNEHLVQSLKAILLYVEFGLCFLSNGNSRWTVIWKHTWNYGILRIDFRCLNQLLKVLWPLLELLIGLWWPLSTQSFFHLILQVIGCTVYQVFYLLLLFFLFLISFLLLAIARFTVIISVCSLDISLGWTPIFSIFGVIGIKNIDSILINKLLSFLLPHRSLPHVLFRVFSCVISINCTLSVHLKFVPLDPAFAAGWRLLSFQTLLFLLPVAPLDLNTIIFLVRYGGR